MKNIRAFFSILAILLVVVVFASCGLANRDTIASESSTASEIATMPNNMVGNDATSSSTLPDHELSDTTISISTTKRSEPVRTNSDTTISNSTTKRSEPVRTNSDTTISNSTTKRSEPVKANFVQGELKDQELKTFFHNNQELLQDVEVQLSNYRSEDLYGIYYHDSQLRATNGDGKQVALDPQLKSLIELYFSAVGTNNEPRISIRDETASYHPSIDFTFRLPDNIDKGIRYSPEYRNENWKPLGGDWYIFEEGLV